MLSSSRTKLIFYVVFVLTWSVAWFAFKAEILASFPPNNALGNVPFALIPTLGILIAVLIIQKANPTFKIPILGKAPLLSILIVVLPILCLGFFGVSNTYDIHPSVFGLGIGLFTMLYAFLEELGWRGYLQQELMTKWNKWITYLCIALVWYVWHWFFLRSGNDPKLIMLPILFMASFGIGEVFASTRSLFTATALHGIVNILLLYPIIADSLDQKTKLIVLGICLAFWFPAFKYMEKNLEKIE